ncbi:hypothetical protein AB1Y20_000426 [Prymnesium parvum]|uniref:Uncharacterized protein n=1 Tax=Prymnesium parvum TaxID=97485 RepID=A0AB34KA23_PRYPA
MERVTVRAYGCGAVGYVCLPSGARCSLARLREHIESQLGSLAALPVPFSFVRGGLLVSRPQEAFEELIAPEVFIARSEPGTHQLESPSTWPDSADELACMSFRLDATHQPLVQQWVDAFGYLSEREQLEAMALLRLRHPTSAGSPEGAPSGPHLLNASSPQRRTPNYSLSRQSRARRPGSCEMNGSRSADSLRTRSVSPRWGSTDGSQPASASGTPPRASRVWHDAASPGSAASLDDRIEQSHNAKEFRREHEMQVSEAQQLHAGRSCTPTSRKANLSRSSPAAFSKPATPKTPTDAPQHAHNGVSLSSAMRKCCLSRNSSASALDRLILVGEHRENCTHKMQESPRATTVKHERSPYTLQDRSCEGSPVAFGSGRPQRPDEVVLLSTTLAPRLGRQGDVLGVF